MPSKKMHSIQTEGNMAVTTTEEIMITEIVVIARITTLIKMNDSMAIADSATSMATRNPNAGKSKSSAEIQTTGSITNEATPMLIMVNI